MADTLELENVSPPVPVRVVLAAATREMRTALFVVTDDPGIRLVASASTMAELATYTRSFQPDGVIVADDLASPTDLAAKLVELQRILRHGSILVVGPSADVIAAKTGATTAAESLDLLDVLSDLPARGSPLGAMAT